MKSRFFGVSLLLLSLLAPVGFSIAEAKSETVSSSFVYQAINKYKQKNYTGCIQDMDYAIKHGKNGDIAYYYKAISYTKLGMQEEAKEAYENARKITKNGTIYDYSTQALMCIENPASCQPKLGEEDITTFIKSEKFMHKDVRNDFQNKAVNRAKEEINSDVKPAKRDTTYLNMDNSTPTDKEIADAVRTFQKLGINPFNSGMMLGYGGQNAELMQMSALLGNQNNNNNAMNMIPMLTAMQTGNSNVSKEFVQTYMMNQMLSGFNLGSDDK